MKTEFKIQDPKTFDQPNYNLINKTVKQILLKQKEQFLNLYYNLSNTDKFYTLLAVVNSYEKTEIDIRDVEWREEIPGY